MSLTGSSNEEKIWNFLISKGLNKCGAAGLMGNLQAESGLRPNNLQNSYEKKLNMTDDAYTQAVDKGTYSNFVRDSAGYGLAQWTYWSRKQNLLDFAKSRKSSIGDLEMQLEFLYKEISNYKNVISVLKNAKTVLEASNAVLFEYERPANQSATVQKTRASYGEVFFNKYAKQSSEAANSGQIGGATMSNSSLVNCTVMSPNHSGKRTHVIDRITPHCVVGQLSAEDIGGCFTNPSRQASCNYGIGPDGRVCLIVDEANRSWCSSSGANDQRAVTIEVASDKTAPYAFKDAAYNKLVELCVDICRRNGKNTLLWIEDKNKALAYEPKSNEMLLTVHRWFANKSCPGDWMFSRMGDLASKVTKALGGTATQAPKPPVVTPTKKSNEEIAKEVINGRWGNGAERKQRLEAAGYVYADVQKIVDAMVKGTYGQQPAASAPAKKSNEEIAKEVINGRWGNGADRKNRLEAAGYVYADVQRIVDAMMTGSSNNTTQSSGFPYMVRVTTDALNYRSGPGTQFNINGCIRDRGSYTIVAQEGNWGKLKSGAGWICLDYTQRI